MNLETLKPILLKDIEKVKLMNRVDTKFWFHFSYLSAILKEAKEYYYILEIKDKKILSYATTYFDTPLNCMYTAHHNGKLNRFKIRHRTYVESNISFLEIKHKSNKGRTIKSRIPTKKSTDHFNNEEAIFIEENSPFSDEVLLPTMHNKFERITLVGKHLDERCTIDINITFSGKKGETKLSDLVVAEIKTDGLPSNSPLRRILKEKGIKQAGFSKYCIGRMLTSEDIKQNTFKYKIRRINKTLSKTN